MSKSFFVSTYISLYIHIVFATKDRSLTMGAEWMQDLHNYVAGTVNGLGAKAMIVNGVEDHIHVLASLKSTHCVSDLVRETKKASSSWAAAKSHDFAWQTGYAAFSVGAPELQKVTQYIARQREHHTHLSSSDELRALLVEHGIEIDERFFI